MMLATDVYYRQKEAQSVELVFDNAAFPSPDLCRSFIALEPLRLKLLVSKSCKRHFSRWDSDQSASDISLDLESLNENPGEDADKRRQQRRNSLELIDDGLRMQWWQSTGKNNDESMPVLRNPDELRPWTRRNSLELAPVLSIRRINENWEEDTLNDYEDYDSDFNDSYDESDRYGYSTQTPTFRCGYIVTQRKDSVGSLSSEGTTRSMPSNARVRRSSIHSDGYESRRMSLQSAPSMLEISIRSNRVGARRSSIHSDGPRSASHHKKGYTSRRMSLQSTLTEMNATVLNRAQRRRDSLQAAPPKPVRRGSNGRRASVSSQASNDSTDFMKYAFDPSSADVMAAKRQSSMNSAPSIPVRRDSNEHGVEQQSIAPSVEDYEDYGFDDEELGITDTCSDHGDSMSLCGRTLSLESPAHKRKLSAATSPMKPVRRCSNESGVDAVPEPEVQTAPEVDVYAEEERPIEVTNDKFGKRNSTRSVGTARTESMSTFSFPEPPSSPEQSPEIGKDSKSHGLRSLFAPFRTRSKSPINDDKPKSSPRSSPKSDSPRPSRRMSLEFVLRPFKALIESVPSVARDLTSVSSLRSESDYESDFDSVIEFQSPEDQLCSAS